MGWVTKYDGYANATFDANNGRAVVTYIVTITAGNLTKSPLAEPGAPAWLSPHPQYPGLLLNGYSIPKLVVTDVYEVDGYFATDAWGTLGNIPPENMPNYKYITGSSKRRTVKAPSFVSSNIPYIGFDGSMSENEKWDLHTLDLECYENDYEVRCNVATLSLVDINSVYSKVNKFFEIPLGGHAYYKFTNFGYSNATPNKWQLVYSFTYDSGNPGLGTGLLESIPVVDANGIATGANRRCVMPPQRGSWQSYVVIPTNVTYQAGNDIPPPTIGLQYQYTTSDVVTGIGRTMPGNPLT